MAGADGHGGTQPDAVEGAQLSIMLFGGCRLAGPRGAIEIGNRKARALLAYLAVSRSGAASRETLAALLWSDRTEAQARTSLRQCLRQIRVQFEAAGFDGFRASREELRLDRTRVRLDLAETLETLERLDAAAPEPRLLDREHHPAQLLHGYDSLAPGFEAWVRVQRRQWEDRLTRHLRAAMQAAPPAAAADAARFLIAIDPTHEEAHRTLVRHHAGAGNVPAALRQYERLWNLLAEDYDMEPDVETQALIVEIKSGAFVPEPRAGGLAEPSAPASLTPAQVAPRLPVIGVWSFARGGPWAGDDHLIEGIRRDLIAALVRFREWVVIEGRTSLAGPSLAPGADYAVEGSYYEEAGEVHLVITLRDTVQNRYIWSERVAISADSWLGVRRQLVRKIAVSLNVYLSVDAVREGFGPDDAGRGVYARWLAAQELSYRWRPQDELEAERELRRLIGDAPGFAPAYSSLVQIMNSRHHVFPGRRRSAAQHAEALELARRAVEHDPLDCRTQLCLAWSYAMNQMYSQAAMTYRLAHSLNENDPWTVVSCALGLAYCDELEEAAALERQAQNLGLELSPLHWAYRGGVRFLRGDHRGAVEAAARAEDATFYIAGWRAAALANCGRIEEAREEADRFVRTIGAHWFGEAAPSRGAIAEWFLEAFPIRSRDGWAALRDGLARAGLACPDAP